VNYRLIRTDLLSPVLYDSLLRTCRAVASQILVHGRKENRHPSKVMGILVTKKVERFFEVVLFVCLCTRLSYV